MDHACFHCGASAADSSHKPGLDCVRFICGLCVDKAVRPHGRSLRFPRDEQEEFLLTGNSRHAHAQEVPA
jgi:hypothetical protein